jgi:hypothetical protein
VNRYVQYKKSKNMGEEDRVDREIRRLIEKKELEIDAFKKLLKELNELSEQKKKSYPKKSK